MSTIRREQLRSPLSASYALTASYAENANITFDTSSLVTTSSFNAFTSSINNFTASYNTGSFSGSFTGSFNGTASWATNALTASYTPNAIITASVNSNTITFTKGDGSTFPITVNTGSGGGGDVSGFVTTSSFNAFTASINTFTSSYNTGSFSGSFTGSLSGTASYALTASYIENLPIFNTGGLVTTSSFNAFTSSINSFTASYNTGSFSGSFTGSLYGTASWAENALTASYYNEVDPVFVAKEPSLATTGSNQFLGNQFITGSVTTFKDTDYQELFSSTFTVSGDIIKTNNINPGITTYDLVMLDDNDSWSQSNYTSSSMQNQLGICLYINSSEALILLNGDITINTDIIGPGPFVDKANVGYAVIPSTTNGKMNSVTSGLLANGYHRSLGFIYYRNISSINNYIMRFNPSNDSYQIIP
jgi:hypothetical protein